MAGPEPETTAEALGGGVPLLRPEADSAGRIAGAALIMMAGIALSRASGVVRVIVFPHMCGMSADTDAYVQAFRIPDFLYFLMAGGALATGFIPTFTERLAKGREAEAWRTLSALFTVLLVGASVLVGLGIVFAPALVSLVGPTFDARARELCALMMRIIFPAQLCFVLGGLLMGALHSLRVFLWSALAPATYNLCIRCPGTGA